MTSCARYADLDFVERYVLGQMDSAEQDAFEAHYFECPDCFAAVQALQTAQTVLREAPAQATPEAKPPVTPVASTGRVVDFNAHTPRAKGDASAASGGASSGRGQGRMMTGAAWIGLAAAASLTGVLVWAPWRDNKPSAGEPSATVAQQTPGNTQPAGPKFGPSPSGGGAATPTPGSGTAASQPSGTGPGIPSPKPNASPAPARPPISLDALALIVPPPYVPLQTRGNDAQAQGEAFAAAMTKYAAKDYRGAIDGLKPIADAQPDAIPAQFFLGISYLALNEPANASAVLNRVASSDVAPYADEAHFYLAKAALGARDLDRAERELSLAIERQAGPPNEAQKVQQSLRIYRREHNQD